MLSQKSIFIAFLKKTLRSESTVDNPKCLENLVKEFEDVFQDPLKGLPPLRGNEHQIDFIPGLLYQIDQHIRPIQPRPRKFNNNGEFNN